MPPPRSSHFRTPSDWIGDPWASPEERRAWDQARKRKFISSISDRDWKRLGELAGKVGGSVMLIALDNADCPYKVAVCEMGSAGRFAGVKIGELRGAEVLVFEPVKTR